MFEIIRSADRGHANHGWLDTRHTFSFADYHNPSRMGFGSLRVINEDVIAPQSGFGTHPHRDMEIVTYLVSGELAHKDSMGNGSTIRAGELQRMTAGTGVLHSEFNRSDEETHLLQIWILPERTGLEPGYEQKLFPPEAKSNRWCVLASRDGRDGSLTIHQDATLLATLLDAGESLEHAFAAGRSGFLQVVEGAVDVSGEHLSAGDGMAISDTAAITVTAEDAAELLLFDLA
ncbi:MAG: pirin family protein [Woeseiaceae bacterium]|nr:pirin family protein [Woeseiaceae bacterium]